MTFGLKINIVGFDELPLSTQKQLWMEAEADYNAQSDPSAMSDDAIKIGILYCNRNLEAFRYQPAETQSEFQLYRAFRFRREALVYEFARRQWQRRKDGDA